MKTLQNIKITLTNLSTAFIFIISTKKHNHCYTRKLEINQVMLTVQTEDKRRQGNKQNSV